MPMTGSDPAGMRIAVILPPREEFTRERSGAVALTVHDFLRHSRWRNRITIFGGTPCDRADVDFVRLPTERLAVLRATRTGAYAAHFLRRYRNGAPFTQIEVHNRPLLFNHLRDRLPPGIALSLFVHNDPQGMAGLRTPRQRSRLLARAAAVICVSEFLRDRFLDRVERGGDRLQVIHNGIAVDLLEPPAKDRNILYVGRIVPDKGVLEMAHALRLLEPELADWTVTLIGEAERGARPGYEVEVDAALSVFGNRYLRLRQVPHAAVMQQFRRSAIAVVPSLWHEPFGRTALEAMAGSCAVVTSGSGGLREVVGDAGSIVDPTDTEALAAAIRRLVRDDNARDDFQAQGHARAAALFEIRHLSASLDKLREQLDGARRRTARRGAPVQSAIG